MFTVEKRGGKHQNGANTDTKKNPSGKKKTLLENYVLTSVARQSNKILFKAAIVRVLVNLTGTFGLLSVRPRVFTAVFLCCALIQAGWRYIFSATAVTHILI